MAADRQGEATAERAVALRVRPDLVAGLQRYRGRRYWGIKDPVALRYFHLRDEEYFLLKSLDGRTSADQIRRKFEQRFAPRKLDLGHLHAFFGLLYRQGLLLAEAPGQAEPLLQRRGEQARQTAIAAAGNLLAIRLRGVDPERFLAWLYPFCRWLFAPASRALFGLVAVSALLLVAVEFDVLRARLPDLPAFFSPPNLVWLAIAVGLTKVIHELAHGLTCRHYGGECHEIGLMLLVFTPCLYCNVSDAWMLPDKWQRAAVGMAGMAAEITLASFSTFLWWFTEPGPLNSFLLNIMIVCSVNTLLLNGNPLLRFDGYYVLSDLLEVPNLQPQSSAVVVRYVQKWLLGIEPRAGAAALGDPPRWLALYAIGSTIYRLLVVVTILWLCHRVLRVYQLESLAHLLTVFVVGGLLAGPVWRTAKFLNDPGERRRLKGPGRWSGRALLVLGLAGLLFVPMPTRVVVPAMVEPEGAKRVYVTVPGSLQEFVAVGEPVRAGQALARLENREIRREVAELSGLHDMQQVRLANLHGRRVLDPLVERQIPAAEESLRDLERRLAERRRDESRLTLAAPRDGTVLPAPARFELGPEGELPTWSGVLLDDRHLGSYLQTGELVCLVGDPRRFQALLVVDESDVALVALNQRVRVHLDLVPGRILEGRIQELSEINLETAPRELLTSGLLPTRENQRGEPQPLRSSYLVRVSLETRDVPLLLGASGRAKIHLAPQSLAARANRYLRRTLRFEW